ncbi:ARM repeat-containing protein, partial [Rozella allomycis CSF55]
MTTDSKQLYDLFLHTLHQDQNLRMQAELHLKQALHQPGFMSSLLQLISNVEADLAVRQIATVYFKNRLKYWDDKNEQTGQPEISEDDKVFIKMHFLSTLVASPSVVQTQLISSLRSILRHDFPEKWVNFVPDVVSLLQSEQLASIKAGIMVSEKIACWRAYDADSPNEKINAMIAPDLLRLAKNIISNMDGIPDSVFLMRTLFKGYFKSIQFVFPVCLQDSGMLNAWIEIFIKAFQLPLPANLIDLDGNEASENIYWKMKKWACHCMNRLFTRYGNPSNQSVRVNVSDEFAATYSKTVAKVVLEVYLQALKGYDQDKKNGYLTTKIRELICDYLCSATALKSTWKIIQANFEFILTRFILPELCYSKEDDELWNEDPYEYIHKKFDPLDDASASTCSVMNLLIDLVTIRKKHTLFPTLTFINSVLNHYLESNEKDPRSKDGALCMVGSIAHVLLAKKSQVRNQMEHFLMMHVQPELSSQFPFLRARACWVIENFSGVNFTNESNALSLFQGIANCLQDKELPVKVRAASAISGLLQVEQVQHSMKQFIPQLMEILLKLTNESDMEATSSVMEKIVDLFPEQVIPFSLQLCCQLRDTFMRQMNEYTAAEEEGEDGFTDGPS